MTDEDHEAAENLATDMTLVDAAKFLRSQSGLTLREAVQWAQKIGAARADTPLGRSYAARSQLT